MNDLVSKFWQEYCDSIGDSNLQYKEAFQFGIDPDRLAYLVIDGKKVATTSGYDFYKISNEEVPKVNEYSIVLNSFDMPVAIIKVTNIDIVPLNEVSEEFAFSEGANSYEQWWDAHVEFLKYMCKANNMEFKEDMLVVCETFEKVY